MYEIVALNPVQRKVDRLTTLTEIFPSCRKKHAPVYRFVIKITKNDSTSGGPYLIFKGVDHPTVTSDILVRFQEAQKEGDHLLFNERSKMLLTLRIWRFVLAAISG